MKKIWFGLGAALFLASGAFAETEAYGALLADLAPEQPPTLPVLPEAPAEPPAEAPATPEIAPNPELDVGEIQAVAEQAEAVPEGELTGAVTTAAEAAAKQPNVLRHWHNTSYGFEIVDSYPVGIALLWWGAPAHRYSIDGLRLSLGAYSHHRLRGIDIGLASVTTKDADGIQFNILVNDVQRTMRGVQIGLYNKAIKNRGLQVGFLNVSDNLCGVQIGVVNISQHIGLPLINIAW